MPATNHFRLRARRNVHLPARISARESGIKLDTVLLDLGLEGACIELQAPVEVGDPVSITVELPGLWDPLVLDAIVTWTAPENEEHDARAGVHFSSPNGQSLLLIAELVARA
ncbi:MAG TPA: PilZ domain-containing protein [Polyangiaceae bacterium]|nr:PilZ domain-containing protein [Polyangiaceae bacterium]